MEVVVEVKKCRGLVIFLIFSLFFVSSAYARYEKKRDYPNQAMKKKEGFKNQRHHRIRGDVIKRTINKRDFSRKHKSSFKKMNRPKIKRTIKKIVRIVKKISKGFLNKKPVLIRRPVAKRIIYKKPVIKRRPIAKKQIHEKKRKNGSRNNKCKNCETGG